VLDHLAKIATAPTSPRFETHEEALERFPGLTRDAYALSRVINSEHGSGTPTEMCCIGDADANKAARQRRSIFDHVTAGTGQYGHQGEDKRPVSTARAPGPRHVVAALAVLAGPQPFGMRGIARGAERYFDVKAQAASAASSPETHCPPLVILERWTYSLPWGSERCTLGTKRGGDQQEWVGPIPGVDPYVLMLMRPATAHQDALYQDARRVIESRGSYKGRWLPDAVDLALLAVVVGGAWLAAQGVIG